MARGVPGAVRLDRRDCLSFYVDKQKQCDVGKKANFAANVQVEECWLVCV
jgi:hypothetical protein